MKIKVKKETGILRDVEMGQAAWIPLDVDDLGAGWCLVLRTGVGYVALETGYTDHCGCLDYPAIPANVKIVEV